MSQNSLDDVDDVIVVSARVSRAVEPARANAARRNLKLAEIRNELQSRLIPRRSASHDAREHASARERGCAYTPERIDAAADATARAVVVHGRGFRR